MSSRQHARTVAIQGSITLSVRSWESLTRPKESSSTGLVARVG